MTPCSTCSHWNSPDGNVGECRRFPPQVLVVGYMAGGPPSVLMNPQAPPQPPKPMMQAFFPVTPAEAGCGEHEPTTKMISQ